MTSKFAGERGPSRSLLVEIGIAPTHAPEPRRDFDALVEHQVTAWLEAAALVDIVGSVAEASRRLRVTRRSIDDARWVLELDGLDGLRDRAARAVRRRATYRRRVEQEILAVARANPRWGRKRVAKAVARRGYVASPSAVRRVLRCRATGQVTDAPTSDAAGEPSGLHVADA